MIDTYATTMYAVMNGDARKEGSYLLDMFEKRSMTNNTEHLGDNLSYVIVFFERMNVSTSIRSNARG